MLPGNQHRAPIPSFYGVDPQRMHVMQTSLFRVPEEAAALKVMKAPKRTTFLIDKALNRKLSQGSDGDSLFAEYS
jgi:nuclear pore complex protein Nup98-Nup96